MAVDDDDESKPKYVIPKRKTRGQRVEELIGEAAEADADFWGQKAWEEVSEDEDIASDDWSDSEKEDKEDSDFDNVDENQEESERIQQAISEEDQEKRKRRSEAAKRRKGVYVDPALARQAKLKETAGKGKTTKRPRNVVIPRSSREMRATTSSKTINSSTAVKRSQIKTESRPKKVIVPLVKLTQQQLLEEAAKTEVENQRSLELMLMIQEESKREKQKAATQSMPRRIYFSSSRNVKKDASGKGLNPITSTLSFTHTRRVPPVINAKAPAVPEQSVCSVTGLPAKYRDPLTKIPYRTIEAFKVIRGSAPKKQKVV